MGKKINKKSIDKLNLKPEDRNKIKKLGVRGTVSLSKLTQQFNNNLCSKCQKTLGKDICEDCLDKNYKIMLKMKELRDKWGL